MTRLTHVLIGRSLRRWLPCNRIVVDVFSTCVVVRDKVSHGGLWFFEIVSCNIDIILLLFLWLRHFHNHDIFHYTDRWRLYFRQFNDLMRIDVISVWPAYVLLFLKLSWGSRWDCFILSPLSNKKSTLSHLISGTRLNCRWSHFFLLLSLRREHQRIVW